MMIIMNDTQDISILIKQSPLEMFNQIQHLKKHNEELQSIDSLQQMTIERLNKEVHRLRESLFLLEDQYKRTLVQNTSIC
jgi:predicted nuclease with TOPRIM domain